MLPYFLGTELNMSFETLCFIRRSYTVRGNANNKHRRSPLSLTGKYEITGDVVSFASQRNLYVICFMLVNLYGYTITAIQMLHLFKTLLPKSNVSIIHICTVFGD